MSGRALVRLLKRHGYKVVRSNGSHHWMEKEGCDPVVVPVHSKDVARPILLSILRKAGLQP